MSYEIYSIPGDAGILRLMKGKLTIGKVKSSRLSLFLIFLRCRFHCEGQSMKQTFEY
jgi:hypothetical protein